MLVLGATSMVGSHFAKAARFPIAAAGRTNPEEQELSVERFDRVDYDRPDELGKVVGAAPEPVIVNFAAMTNVDQVERERPTTGSGAGGRAWNANTLTPRAVAAAARSADKFFVQISTDFVFDGTAGPYEVSTPRSPFTDRMSWYGWTKSEGERLASAEDPGVAIVRISYPYGTAFAPKLDFARWILARRRNGTLPLLYANQQITPTWIPDVTETLDVLIRRRLSGVFHVASPETTSPLEFGRELIALAEGSVPDLPAGSLGPPAPGSGIAPRPLLGGLRTHRTVELGVHLTPWRTGIKQLVLRGEGHR